MSGNLPTDKGAVFATENPLERATPQKFTGWEMFPLEDSHRNDGSVYIKQADYERLQEALYAAEDRIQELQLAACADEDELQNAHARIAALEQPSEPETQRVGDMDLGDLYRHCRSNPVAYSILRRLVQFGTVPEITDPLDEPPAGPRSADEPRAVLLDKSLRQYAHATRMEACAAWSDCTQLPHTLDVAKCEYAKAVEDRLRNVIDELADLSKPSEPVTQTRDHTDWIWRWIDRITCGACSVQSGLSVLTYSPMAPRWVQKIKSSDPLPELRPGNVSDWCCEHGFQQHKRDSPECERATTKVEV